LRLTGHTRVAAVIGDPVRHSRSPAILNAAFSAAGLDWVYVAFEVPAGGAVGALDAMRALDLGGMSVTMPHKEAAAAAVDRLTDDAAALGAVNCVTPLGGGLLEGDNTDGPGFVDALRLDLGFDPAGRRCVVVGAGGAARAVVVGLGRAGAAEVAVVNRTASRGEAAAALAGPAGRLVPAEAVDGAELIVNATPLGMTDGAELPVDPARLGPGQLVVDLVYHPPTTPLLAAAASRGAATANGLGMLVHQAAHAFRRWTGEAPPLDVMRAAATTAEPTETVL
jgi:shikimate dehydrogenase